MFNKKILNKNHFSWIKEQKCYNSMKARAYKKIYKTKDSKDWSLKFVTCCCTVFQNDIILKGCDY